MRSAHTPAPLRRVTDPASYDGLKVICDGAYVADRSFYKSILK
jgi:hypothetical protein